MSQSAFAFMPETFLMRKFIIHHSTLVLSLVFSVALTAGRVFYTGELTYIFLIWNLFLATLPYIFSLMVGSASRAVRFGGVALCIFFLPNAPYIITDLFHLRWHSEPSIWFDTLLIASFAWNGLLLFFHTLQRLEAYLAKGWNYFRKMGGVFLLCSLCAYGIYIGRYMRYNSWDVFVRPMEVFYDLSSHLFHPWEHPRTWSMTLVYAFFLMIGYCNFRFRGLLPGRLPISKSVR